MDKSSEEEPQYTEWYHRIPQFTDNEPGDRSKDI